MANYYGTSRTNYFRVTDEDEYAKLFDRLVGFDGDVEDFTEEKDGIIWHGFGAYSEISYENEDGDYDFDEFCEKLSAILPEDEAFIYTEVGNEKLRFICGYSIVVTHNDIQIMNLQNEAVSLARMMLGKDDFETELYY